MSAFKVGDKVRCVNNRGLPHIAVGDVRIVGAVYEKAAFKCERSIYWEDDMFELVTTPAAAFKVGDKVRFKDHPGAETREVSALRVEGGALQIKLSGDCWFAASLCELVTRDGCPLTVRTQPTTDLQDWRTWAKTAPGQCACGITKKDCEYHR